MKRKILIVDDQAKFREAVAFEIEMLGYQAAMAEDGQRAMAMCRDTDFDLIISDIRMPGWDGARLLSEFRKFRPVTPPFVLMTGFSDLKIQDAYNLGADAFLAKPINPEHLEATLQRLLLPLPEQFKQDFIERPAHHLALYNPSITIGRHGFLLNDFAPEVLRWKVGESVNFKLSLEDDKHPFKKLEGFGRIRWIQQSEGEDFKSGLGMEILRLASPSPDEFVKYIEKEIIVAVIPAA